MTVSITVRNGGSAEAGASVVRFYVSRDLTLDAADVALAAAPPVPALQPDASAAATTAVTLPAITAGPYYLLAVADGDQAVRERNELNNVVARMLHIAVF
jgi:subtilase family serine protease